MQVKKKHLPPVWVDEAGRWAWAGPVSAAAFVVLDTNVYRTIWWKRLTDSKCLKIADREALFLQIEKAKNTGKVDFSVCLKSEKEIDTFGIKEANRRAMEWALGDLSSRVSLFDREIWIDGKDNYVFEWINSICPPKFIVRGDLLHKNISAASICAKVTRDRFMMGIPDEKWYGFYSHKGYGTALHQRILEKYGPISLHRASYAPIKKFANPAE